MATTKLPLPVALLLCGLMVTCSIRSTEVQARKLCPMICPDVKYMTCPSTGDEQLEPACNCCLVDEDGCTIYLITGEAVNCHSRN
ncbi:hypothetical protein ACP70R_024530 [Stipagrostis hirtigluma subsp. patula]